MEVLAAASSVFAVVSLALQLADNVQRLVDFWDSVKDAPSEVAEIRSQLRVLGALLRRIEIDVQHAASDDGDSLGHECLVICKGSVAKLEKLSRELDHELSRNGIQRKWSCLRKALREKELASYWSELERAKSTLIMYQCLRNGQHHESLLQLMTKTIRMTPHEKKFEQQPSPLVSTRDILVPISSRFKKVHLGTALYEVQLSFGTIRIRLVKESVIDKSFQFTDKETIGRPKHLRIVATFLPKFTSWRILECTFNQRNNSVDAGLHTFNLRPGWSPIFEYSSRGDVQNVRRLIEEGLASPNDVDPDGWTVLHCAAASHQANTCQMLLALGAIPDPVTKRQETPLLLATHADCRNVYFRPINDETASLDTVRVLVEQGKNDPMQIDDIGWTSIFTATKNRTSQSLLWLMNQEEYELDLNYTTPGGITAAALIVQREDLTAALFEPLLRNRIAVDAPCAKRWRFQFGVNFLTFREPSMIQYAVWNWYDKLLNSYDTRFPYRRRTTEFDSIPSPLPTIKTLLAHGASLHGSEKSQRTILHGLVTNIIQFDGCLRPYKVLESSMSTWLEIVQDLGFDLKEYLRTEAENQKGTYYDLGAGIHMMVCFNEDTAPHIWNVYQGSEERKQGICVDRIWKCANWNRWWSVHAVVRPPRTHSQRWKLLSEPTEIILVKSCDCPSVDDHIKGCPYPDRSDGDFEDAQKGQPPPNVLVTSILHLRHDPLQVIMRYIILATRYRHEFTFYVVLLSCLFGLSYFARFWIATSFFMTLKVLQGAISY